MIDLNSIKAGDAAPVPVAVRFDWSGSKVFWVPGQVVRTTKTQVLLSNGYRVRKSDGTVIGDKYNKYKPPGDIDYKAEAEKMAALKRKIRLKMVINDMKIDLESITPEIADCIERLQGLLSGGGDE